MTNRFACILALLLNGAAGAQNVVALPEVVNYSKRAYGAGSQNWKMCQDKAGIVYFANNEGLLSFDGNFWKKYTLPGNSGLRSLAMGEDGRVYVGAQGQIGYFEPGANGRLEYHSLNELIPAEQRDFTDVWDVIPYGQEILFRSFRRILHYANEKISSDTNVAWSFLGEVNGKLYAKAYRKGLLQFRNGVWTPFLRNDILSDRARVVAMEALQHDTVLVVTKSDGIFLLVNDRLQPFITPDLAMIAEKNPYAVATTGPDRIAITTSLGGCYIINHRGELIQRIAKQDGLQSNNILGVFVDRNKNLWLGSPNGIDFVAYDNAIKHIYADEQEHSAARAAFITDNALYIGTSNGLFRAPITARGDISFEITSFSLIPGTKGQVWNLSEVNNQLLMGHNDGFFVVKGHKAQMVDNSTGFWTFMPLTNMVPSPVMLAGAYNGVNLYKYNHGRFDTPSIHSHIESIRFAAIDGNTVWACHPYKGLYRLTLAGTKQPSYTAYRDTKGILSKNNNHLFVIKSRIVLTNDNGLFEFNSRTDDFEPSIFLKNLLPPVPIDYLKEDANGNIWFVYNKQLGVVSLTGTKKNITYFPELNDRIMGNGFEYVYPYNNSNILVAGEEGFYHINYDKYKERKETVPILLSTIRANNNRQDSVIFGGYDAGQKAATDVPFAWNSLHFEYSAGLYGKQNSIEYAYYLEHYDKNWSPWSKKNEKDYTYLSPGTYIFRVKARTHEGEESAIASYSITVLPPWYRTVWANLLYFILALAAAYALYRWQERRFIAQQAQHEEERKRLEYLNQLQTSKHEEEQKQLMYLHQLELERNEKQIITLQNEKLASEIELKNVELASTTLNLIQKGETLVKVKEEFVRMKKDHAVDKESEDYKKIIRMLSEDKLKKTWEQFAVHFDKVHSNFLVALKEQFPNLTPSEIKLCALLRLNLSSKEMAQIMNISLKSVELARYRLRKKLQVKAEENLVNFLLNVQAEPVKANA